jgi:hypothetical protein
MNAFGRSVRRSRRMVIAVSVISCQWRLAFRSPEAENYWRIENTGSNLAIGQSGFPVGPGLFPIGDS